MDDPLERWSLPPGVGPVTDDRPTVHVDLPARSSAILSPATRLAVWRNFMDERCHYRPAVSGWWLLVLLIVGLLMTGLIVTCASIPQEAMVR